MISNKLAYIVFVCLFQRPLWTIILRCSVPIKLPVRPPRFSTVFLDVGPLFQGTEQTRFLTGSATFWRWAKRRVSKNQIFKGTLLGVKDFGGVGNLKKIASCEEGKKIANVGSTNRQEVCWWFEFSEFPEYLKVLANFIPHNIGLCLSYPSPTSRISRHFSFKTVVYKITSIW